MIVRLIAETLTPIVAKSRFLRVHGAQGVVSNHPYLDLKGPSRHGCRTTLIVKQGIQGFPVYRRAHMGYLHLDFKVRTRKQANHRIQAFLQLQYVGQLTAWGYGEICWIRQKSYSTQESSRPVGPRFRILKGLPPNLSRHERQLVMAALLHDLVNTDLHPSKLGCPVAILDPYVQWLCEQHHTLNEHPDNPDLQLLQEADVRTSRYARLLGLQTSRRKMAPVNTQQLAHQLEQAAQCSIYQLYSVIYHSQELNSLTASKAHPTETLRNHLIGVANWVLFLLRTRVSTPPSASAALTGQPGATPGPVEMEDPRDRDEP
ncbi:MAG: hypothetical protein ACE5I5_18360 [Candidatus Heimdallarchaeota archaeon]